VSHGVPRAESVATRLVVKKSPTYHASLTAFGPDVVKEVCAASSPLLGAPGLKLSGPAGTMVCARPLHSVVERALTLHTMKPLLP
jgi:hypothetical protein